MSVGEINPPPPGASGAAMAMATWNAWTEASSTIVRTRDRSPTGTEGKIGTSERLSLEANHRGAPGGVQPAFPASGRPSTSTPATTGVDRSQRAKAAGAAL
jgi:hypothetical protein